MTTEPDARSVADVLYPVWQPFGERLREEENRGALYGIFWQVIGHPGAEPKYNEADAYAKNPWDSFGEMQRAFRTGVDKGRVLAADPTIHRHVAAAIARRMAEDGLDEDIAASIALNDTWQQATGGAPPQFVDFP